MNHHKVDFSQQAGFSLIEMSIVLVIVGVLLGSMMGPIAIQFERSQRIETRKTLDEVRDAIYGFALTNGRLPCPDIDQDGQEDRRNWKKHRKSRMYKVCQKTYGFLPWATLATGKQDAWGHPFIYQVTASFADNKQEGLTLVSFSLSSKGDIQVFDGVNSQLMINVPAIVLSPGKNGCLKWKNKGVKCDKPSRMTADERENMDNYINAKYDKKFVDRPYSAAEGNEYDDMVVWVVPAVLKNKLREAGMLVSQRVETRKTLDEVRDAIYGFALTNERLPCPDIDQNGQEDLKNGSCKRPYGFFPWVTLATGKQDAWGQPLLYRVSKRDDIQVFDGVNSQPINVSAIVLSPGKNGCLKWKDKGVECEKPSSRMTADERENMDNYINAKNDKKFVDRPYSAAEGNEYDDMVVWVVPDVLKKLVEARKLP